MNFKEVFMYWHQEDIDLHTYLCIYQLQKLNIKVNLYSPSFFSLQENLKLKYNWFDDRLLFVKELPATFYQFFGNINLMVHAEVADLFRFYMMATTQIPLCYVDTDEYFLKQIPYKTMISSEHCQKCGAFVPKFRINTPNIGVLSVIEEDIENINMFFKEVIDKCKKKMNSIIHTKHNTYFMKIYQDVLKKYEQINKFVVDPIVFCPIYYGFAKELYEIENTEEKTKHGVHGFNLDLYKNEKIIGIHLWRNLYNLKKINFDYDKKSFFNYLYKKTFGEFLVAIPSYKRYEILKQKTLKTISSINRNHIYIFCNENTNYKDLEDIGYNVIENPHENIVQQRNFITEYFIDGQKLLCIDDDVNNLTHKDLGKLPNYSVFKTFEDSFRIISKNMPVFGFNSNTNFRSPVEIKQGIYSIIFSCYGKINDKSIKLTVEEKEDYEYICIIAKQQKKVLKLCFIGVSTTYWKMRGGIQARLNSTERVIRQNDAAMFLQEKYNDLVYSKQRDNGLVDLRFKFKKNYHFYNH